jgi:hypothetical protein
VAPNPPRDEMSSNFVNALLCSKSGCGHTFAEHRGGTGSHLYVATGAGPRPPPVRHGSGDRLTLELLALNSAWMTASRGVCKGSPCRPALAGDPFRLPVPLPLSRLPG